MASAAQVESRFKVTAYVPAVARLLSGGLPDQLEITASDIEHGAVAVAGAAPLEVLSNSRYGFTLEFFPRTGLFRRVMIYDSRESRSYILPSDGGAIVYRRDGSGKVRALNLEYRFELRPDVTPGIYPFPLMLQLEPLSGPVDPSSGSQ
jgi:hypothetical protein